MTRKARRTGSIVQKQGTTANVVDAEAVVPVDLTGFLCYNQR